MNTDILLETYKRMCIDKVSDKELTEFYFILKEMGIVDKLTLEVLL